MGQVSGSGLGIDWVARVVNCSDTPVACSGGLDHERDVLEIRVGITPDLVKNRVADVPRGIVNGNRRTRHADHIYKLVQHRMNQMRAGHTSAWRPRLPIVFVLVNLDGNFFSRLIADVPKTLCLVEVSKKRVPRIWVVRLSRQCLDGLGHHIINYLLVGIIVIPPAAGRAIPLRCARVPHPCDTTGMDPFSNTHRGVRWIGRDERCCCRVVAGYGQ
ncbi:hypothetical protein ES703_83848 [subsurface metagenome]